MEEVKFKLQPKYNFIYELGMPTGRKVKNSLISLIGIITIYMLTLIINFDSNQSNLLLNEVDFNKFLPYVQNMFLIFVIISFLVFVIRVILQILQYKNTYFTFYNDKAIYEDLFLNQKKKSLLYSNVKEIEIRRTIWDRLNRRGVVIIYSNAERSSGHGMIIYSIKNVKKVYEDISKLVNDFNHSKDKNSNINNIKTSETYLNTDRIEKVNESLNKNEYISTQESQKEFEDSLKN